MDHSINGVVPVNRREFLKSLFFLPFSAAIPLHAEHTGIFRFAQVSDIHLSFSKFDRSRRLYSHSTQLLADALNQIQAAGVHKVIFSGDLINSPKLSDLIRFQQIVERYPLTSYFVPGNHDLSVGNGLQRVDFFAQTGEKGIAGNRIPYLRRVAPNIVFIFLDGVDTSRITANGRFEKEQISWLSAQLKRFKNSGDDIFVFSHYPVYAPFKSRSHEIPPGESQAILQILQKNPHCRAFISGHYHSCKIRKKDFCWHISSPSLVEYPNAFRIFEYSSRGLSVGFQQCRFPALISKSQNRCPWYKLNSGSPVDRVNFLT
ncbi:metallophosphoesterase family protein [Candidatus Riflebacteria bacterium]